MRKARDFQIDTTKEFPHLPRAPIVEAVIQFVATPGRALEVDPLRTALQERFAEYNLQPQHELHAAMTGVAESVSVRHTIGWDGFRLSHQEQKYVCQFKPNGIVFSRLAPYNKWPVFCSEAMRFWKSFEELADPLSIERIGVRFISQIVLAEEETASDFVTMPAAPLRSMGLVQRAFLHQDTFRVPGHPYQINLIRVLQDREPPNLPSQQLFVDIDVGTVDPVNPARATIEQHLNQMRFLKNEVFFKYMKDAERRFGGGDT